jgi:hypothetical protein
LIELLTPKDLDKEKWEDLLKSSTDSTFFQTSEWGQIWQESFPFLRSYFLVDIGSDGSYRAGLPYVKAKKLLSCYYSMPMGTYGGVVCFPGATASGLYGHWMEITSEIKRERLAVFSEARQFELEKLGFSVNSGFSHRLSLPEKRRPALSRSAEKQMGKALGAGFSFLKVEGKKDLSDFNTLVGRRRKKVFYSRKFYDKVAELLLPGGKAAWFLTKKDGNVAGYLLGFPFRDELFLWDADFDPKFSKLRPGYFLMAKVIDWSINKGFRKINLGQSPPDAFGVALFKERMGGEKVPVYEYAYASPVKKSLRAAYEKLKGRK